MPQLQMHMLRVAAVASIICDNFQKKVDKENIITACLLHDMGNIIKFQLEPGPFPDSIYKPEGKEYWKNVKEKFIKKYGNDEHAATIAIAKGLKIETKILDLISSIGFSKVKSNSETSDYATKICSYSDMRVLPQKVSSLNERLADLKERYKSRMGPEKYKSFDNTAKYFYKIEEQIFNFSDIKPEDVEGKKAKQIIEGLKLFKI